MHALRLISRVQKSGTELESNFTKASKDQKDADTQRDKFKLYANFRARTANLKPHQVSISFSSPQSNDKVTRI